MILRLGIEGQQTDLEQKSLVFTEERAIDRNKKARTVDNTQQIDYTPVKKIFTLRYDVVTQTYFNTLESIYDSQRTQLSNLVYTKEQSDGIKNYNVYMPPISKGTPICDTDKIYDVVLRLEEI